MSAWWMLLALLIGAAIGATGAILYALIAVTEFIEDGE